MQDNGKDNNKGNKQEEVPAFYMHMYVPETLGLCQSHRQAFQKLELGQVCILNAP